MASINLDTSELDEFSKDLIAASQDFERGKHTKAFLRKTGNKLKTKTIKHAKSKTNRKTGNLLKGIKRGKPYKYNLTGNMAIRVFGGKPGFHIHLLNNGHRIVDKSGKEHGFVQGKRFMESAAEEHTSSYIEDSEKFVDELLDKHGMS